MRPSCWSDWHDKIDFESKDWKWSNSFAFLNYGLIIIDFRFPYEEKACSYWRKARKINVAKITCYDTPSCPFVLLTMFRNLFLIMGFGCSSNNVKYSPWHIVKKLQLGGFFWLKYKTSVWKKQNKIKTKTKRHKKERLFKKGVLV